VMIKFHYLLRNLEYKSQMIDYHLFLLLETQKMTKLLLKARMLM